MGKKARAVAVYREQVLALINSGLMTYAYVNAKQPKAKFFSGQQCLAAQTVLKDLRAAITAMPVKLPEPAKNAAAAKPIKLPKPAAATKTNNGTDSVDAK